MSEGPITKNGVHPITHQGAKVHKMGHHGAETHAQPKESEKAKAGAKEHGAEGKHPHAGRDYNADMGKRAQAAESTTSGSTKEERKSPADLFYPATSRPGLKGKIER